VNPRIRVGIVNDQPLATAVLRRIVASDHELEIAWSAIDGAEAIDHCRRDTPDIVLMDLIMPNVDGITATRRIMAESPCPILVVSATVGGNMSRVYDAMGAGALDAVVTPQGRGAEADADSRALLRKIRTIHTLSSGRRVTKPSAEPAAPQRGAALSPILAIGASTGGPAAIETILKQLPERFPAAIVVIQHIDTHFVSGFADWLGSRTRLPVRLAKANDLPLAGTVLVANADAHLALGAGGRLVYVDAPEALYQPSVDIFFNSLARRGPSGSCGVLLTGLGRDGAAGLLALRQAGYETIAQDQATSVVFGMPGAAVEIGAAKRVRPIQGIADELIQLFPERK
jgi:chemotaxis response regulator CheB